MSKTKKLVLICSSVAVFLVAFVLATFYDLEISRAIAQLSGESYYSKNLFAVIFECVGESPLYIVCGVGAGIITRYFFSLKNKYLRVVLAVVFAILGVYCYATISKRIVKYVCQNTSSIDLYNKVKTYIKLGSYVVGAGLMVLTLYLVNKIPSEHIPYLLAFAIASVLTLAIAMGFVQGVKGVFGRQRYRTIKVLEYNGMNELVNYTKWFVLNGSRKPTAEMLALGIASDGYKSFPSGHTCAGAMIILIYFIPDCLNMEGKKKAKAKGILLAVSLAYTFAIALSRVVMGAHYATDVLFAWGITYLVAFLSFKLGRFITSKITK